MLYEVREYVSTDTLRSIYYARFDSNYGDLPWGPKHKWNQTSNYSSEKGIEINEFQT